MNTNPPKKERLSSAGGCAGAPLANTGIQGKHEPQKFVKQEKTAIGMMHADTRRSSQNVFVGVHGWLWGAGELPRSAFAASLDSIRLDREFFLLEHVVARKATTTLNGRT